MNPRMRALPCLMHTRTTKAQIYGVRKGSKAAVPVHRYFFTGAPVKFTGGPLNITGAPLYFTGTPLYLPVDC